MQTTASLYTPTTHHIAHDFIGGGIGQTFTKSTFNFCKTQTTLPVSPPATHTRIGSSLSAYYEQFQA